MIDFPRSLIEFQHGFPDECACAAYLADARWPDGFRCPDCDHDKGWELSTKAFTRECAGCGKQTSVTAGTVMHGSKAAADRLVLGGVSDGHALQRDRRPATAEATGARLVQVGLAAVRQAAPGHGGAPPLAAGRPRGDRRDRIPHRTKADPPAGAHGRSAEGKMLIAGAVEVHDGGPRRVRLAPIADFSAAILHAFIKANVEAGATAKTDGWSSYTGAPGVTHDPHVVGPMAAHVVLPWAHRVFANLKTWALGVYHGLREKHLQSYLDEFAFRDTPPSAPCSA